MKTDITRVFECWDTHAEDSRGIERMSEREARQRNDALREAGDPCRWVPVDHEGEAATT